MNNDYSPLECENMLHPYKTGEKILTPDFCKELLDGTNFRRAVRDLLALIEKIRWPESEKYEDTVLRVFSREQPEDIIAMGKRLAVRDCYTDEFERALFDTEHNSHIIVASAPRRNFIYHIWENDPIPEDLSTFYKLTAPAIAVFFSAKTKLPPILDLKKCPHVRFEDGIDLSPVKEISFLNRPVQERCGADIPQNTKITYADAEPIWFKNCLKNAGR